MDRTLTSEPSKTANSKRRRGNESTHSQCKRPKTSVTHTSEDSPTPKASGTAATPPDRTPRAAAVAVNTTTGQQTTTIGQQSTVIEQQNTAIEQQSTAIEQQSTTSGQQRTVSGQKSMTVDSDVNAEAVVPSAGDGNVPVCCAGSMMDCVLFVV